ncbi:sensor histidine kinase [Nocardioides ultimimeridianus]
MDPMIERLRVSPWPAAVAAGVAVLVVGFLEVDRPGALFLYGLGPELLFVVVLAVAVASYRMCPSLGLALLWPLAFLQLTRGFPVLWTELAVALIAYGCARHGTVVTVVLSAASVPAIALTAGLTTLLGFQVRFATSSLHDRIGHFGSVRAMLLRTLVIGVAVLLVPWLIGILLRVLNREAQTRAVQLETARERDQAAELADLREGQARLARDVHDVVGHSLAVILAQAESAQYLPDDDPARLKQTLATIAGSARNSLQDVRHVLGATDGRPPNGGLDTLVDGVRASGHEVLSTEIGDPRPLPPELATVAYRVLQEMLTNAIRHGRRDEPVRVERHWQDELRIEVSNVVDATSSEEAPGNGLAGMRRRLEAVGGRLDVRPRTEDGVPTFTVTAWLPVGAR